MNSNEQEADLYRARLRLSRIRPNLPTEARNCLRRLRNRGWDCRFFLGVHQERLIMGVQAARKDNFNLVFSDCTRFLFEELEELCTSSETTN